MKKSLISLAAVAALSFTACKCKKNTPDVTTKADTAAVVTATPAYHAPTAAEIAAQRAQYITDSTNKAETEAEDAMLQALNDKADILGTEASIFAHNQAESIFATAGDALTCGKGIPAAADLVQKKFSNKTFNVLASFTAYKDDTGAGINSAVTLIDTLGNTYNYKDGAPSND